MTAYDQVLDELGEKIQALSRIQQAVFFASCGEVLLPSYDSFREKSGWGSIEALKKGLSVAWQFAKTGVDRSVNEVISSLESATPHSDDFDLIECKFAQDVAICIDAAVRAASPEYKVEGTWVEYALEPLKTKICLDELDLLDVGSDEVGRRWLDNLAVSELMRSAINECFEVISYLRKITLVTEEDAALIIARLQVLSP